MTGARYTASVTTTELQHGTAATVPQNLTNSPQATGTEVATKPKARAQAKPKGPNGLTRN